MRRIVAIVIVGVLVYSFGDRYPELRELFDQLVQEEQIASAPPSSIPETTEPTRLPQPEAPEADDLTCNGHLAYGIPSQTDQLICRTGYAVGYSYVAKGPVWVAYRLTRASISGDIERTDKFIQEYSIPTEYRARNEDYSGNDYDKGHMAPAESMDSSEKLMFESFRLSNIVPQLPGFNRGIWKALESRIRRWTEERGELYVISGAIYDGGDFFGNDIEVPTQFYKVVYDAAAEETIAFLLPHDDLDSDELAAYLESVDTIESWAEIDVLAVLLDALEISLEAKTSQSMW